MNHINMGIDMNEFLFYWQKADILKLPDPVKFAIGCCLQVKHPDADLAGVSDKALAKLQSVVDIFTKNARPGRVLEAFQVYRAMNPVPGYNGIFNESWC